MNIVQISMDIQSGGQSQQLAISSASAATSAVVTAPGKTTINVTFTPDTNCFVRRGTTPVALSNGTDQFLMANNTYRCEMNNGEKLAFITTSATGNVYFTAGA